MKSGVSPVDEDVLLKVIRGLPQTLTRHVFIMMFVIPQQTTQTQHLSTERSTSLHLHQQFHISAQKLTQSARSTKSGHILNILTFNHSFLIFLNQYYKVL